MITYYFELNSTRQGPFQIISDAGPEVIVARAKKQYPNDLMVIYTEDENGRMTEHYSKEDDDE